ncbi:MAG: nucleotidyltransferase domain-containing protein [Chloroflexota bacterium]
MFSIKTDMAPTGFPPVAETLPEAIERIVAELKPEKIILFGSYAYGNPTPDSDVDLLVIMETTDRQVQRYVAVSNVLHPRRFPVDIIVKTPREVEEAMLGGKDNSFFIREIIKKGKVLYDRRERT